MVSGLTIHLQPDGKRYLMVSIHQKPHRLGLPIEIPGSLLPIILERGLSQNIADKDAGDMIDGRHIWRPENRYALQPSIRSTAQCGGHAKAKRVAYGKNVLRCR